MVTGWTANNDDEYLPFAPKINVGQKRFLEGDWKWQLLFITLLITEQLKKELWKGSCFQMLICFLNRIQFDW